MSWFFAQSDTTTLLPGLSLFQQVLATLFMVGAVIAVGAYLYGQFRTGSSKASSEAIAAQAAEIAALDKRAERLETERNDCTNELHRVQGALEQMERQNTEFRQLIMGETLPRAMEDAFSGVVERVMGEVHVAAQRNLKAYMETFAAMESTYLVPIGDKLEDLQGIVNRRTSKVDDYEGADRRGRGESA